MRVRFLARCERVRVNNGIVEAMFTQRDDGQEQHALINVHVEHGQLFVIGREYWISVDPEPSAA